MTKECRNCHFPMTEKNGSFHHVAFQDGVTLHGVPYWTCKNCDHQFYDDAEKVEEKIVEALLRKQTEIDYN